MWQHIRWQETQPQVHCLWPSKWLYCGCPKVTLTRQKAFPVKIPSKTSSASDDLHSVTKTAIITTRCVMAKGAEGEFVKETLLFSIARHLMTDKERQCAETEMNSWLEERTRSWTLTAGLYVVEHREALKFLNVLFRAKIQTQHMSSSILKQELRIYEGWAFEVHKQPKKKPNRGSLLWNVCGLNSRICAVQDTFQSANGRKEGRKTYSKPAQMIGKYENS